MSEQDLSDDVLLRKSADSALRLCGHLTREQVSGVRQGPAPATLDPAIAALRSLLGELLNKESGSNE